MPIKADPENTQSESIAFGKIVIKKNQNSRQLTPLAGTHRAHQAE
jgi:hypothetical protein